MATGFCAIPAFWLMAYSDLFDAKVRYTDISFIHQFSVIFASGLTPIIAINLLKNGGSEPWHFVAYVAFAGVVSAGSAFLIGNQASKSYLIAGKSMD